jgi:hypothetical protein
MIGRMILAKVRLDEFRENEYVCGMVWFRKG